MGAYSRRKFISKVSAGATLLSAASHASAKTLFQEKNMVWLW